MKKTLRPLLLIFLSLLTAMILMSGGCDDGPSNVGYRYVELRDKSYLDLIRMLDDQDNAKVYNALCNLAFEANNMNSYLLQDSFIGTPKRDTSLIIHRKMSELLSSKDPWVSSTAIRLLGEVKYERKSYLDRILRDNRVERNIQLEICTQLAISDPKDQSLLRNKILFLRKQKDWLMRNSAYGIVRSNDSCATDIFLDDYRHSPDPDTRSLAFYALLQRVDRLSFPLLDSVYRKTQDKTMKKAIQSSMLRSSVHSLAQDWLFAQPELLDSVMEDIIFVALANSRGREQAEDFSPMILRALREGWRPSRTPVEMQSAVYPGEPLLYRGLIFCKYNSANKPDSVTISKAGQAVENALLSDPTLRKEWLDYEARLKPKALSPSLLKQHHMLMDEFLNRSNTLIFRETGDSVLARFFEKELREKAKDFDKITLPWQHERE